MKVLVAVDKCPHTECLVEALAVREYEENSAIRLVTVVEDHLFGLIRDEYDLSAHAPALRHLAEVADRLLQRVSGVEVTVDVLHGHVKETLLEHALEWQADLIALGSHGQRGLKEMPLGSVSQTIVNHARCPVLIAKQCSNSFADGVRIVVALDHSSYSADTIDWVCRQRFRVPVQIQLLTAVPELSANYESETNPERAYLLLEQMEKLHAQVHELMAPYVVRLEHVFGQGCVTTNLAPGDARGVILDAVAAFRANLVVLGSHGRTGLTRFLLGSVSSAVAAHALCAVEVVRHLDVTQFVDEHRREDKQARSNDYIPHVNVFH
jgi:nucleotide-binding universal stress UspA family protein